MGTENMEEFSAREMINKIKDHVVDPKVLSKPVRLACVEYMLFEGIQQGAIAQFLKRSDRTIRRDVEDVRRNNGAGKNAALTQSVLEQVLFDARVHNAQFLRIARNPANSVSDRMRAEFMAWKVSKDVLQELHYMGGFMPTLVESDKTKPKSYSPTEEKLFSDLDKLSGLDRDVVMEKHMRLLSAEVARMVKEGEEFEKAQKAKEALEEQKVSQVPEAPKDVQITAAE